MKQKLLNYLEIYYSNLIIYCFVLYNNSIISLRVKSKSFRYYKFKTKHFFWHQLFASYSETGLYFYIFLLLESACFIPSLTKTELYSIDFY